MLHRAVNIPVKKGDLAFELVLVRKKTVTPQSLARDTLHLIKLQDRVIPGCTAMMPTIIVAGRNIDVMNHGLVHDSSAGTFDGLTGAVPGEFSTSPFGSVEATSGAEGDGSAGAGGGLFSGVAQRRPSESSIT